MDQDLRFVPRLAARALPRSHRELIALLRREPDAFRGRVGTYDIARSAVGYLIASQDARQSGEFGALAGALRETQVVLEGSTTTLLDRLVAGDLAIGYNLLASYAQARIEAGAPLAIIYPDDYTLVVPRTAVLPKNAPHPAAAHLFLDYLMSLHGQQVLSAQGRLFAARPEIEGPYGRSGIANARVGPLRPRDHVELVGIEYQLHGAGIDDAFVDRQAVGELLSDLLCGFQEQAGARAV